MGWANKQIPTAMSNLKKKNVAPKKRTFAIVRSNVRISVFHKPIPDRQELVNSNHGNAVVLPLDSMNKGRLNGFCYIFCTSPAVNSWIFLCPVNIPFHNGWPVSVSPFRFIAPSSHMQTYLEANLTPARHYISISVRCENRDPGGISQGGNSIQFPSSAIG